VYNQQKERIEQFFLIVFGKLLHLQVIEKTFTMEMFFVYLFIFVENMNDSIQVRWYCITEAHTCHNRGRISKVSISILIFIVK
jgi:hypothetical protein